MSPLEPYLHAPRVAYFSMEIALESAIPTYAGGLGVLAGDTVLAAADLEHRLGTAQVALQHIQPAADPHLALLERQCHLGRSSGVLNVSP